MHVSTEKPANASSPSPHSQISDSLGALRRCPSWMMNDHTVSQSKDESEEDADLDDSLSSGLFFRQTNNNNNNNHEGDSGEISNKEEALVEDQEELEGGER